MGGVVNLRQARKRKERDEKAKAAAENRRLHGRPKSEKIEAERLRAFAEKQLDGHRRAKDEE
jgi:hypothetical protein